MGRKKTPTLVRRQAALAATMARYQGRAFDWKAKSTCLQLVWFHLRKMGKRPRAVKQPGSLLGAKRILAELGLADVGDLLAWARLREIAPAAALPGDVLTFASADGIGAMAILAAPRKVVSWHDAAGTLALVDFEPGEVARAFRA